NRTETPKKLSLNIAPNPVRENTTISYAIPKAGNVSVQLYSADGRLVKILDQESRSAGVYTTHLNARELANGVYVVVVKTDNQNITGKLVITH
ncbi:MAG: T9SS type A sorting domain-containing protein, partial [bacterium]